jgi:hypothetical protein
MTTWILILTLIRYSAVSVAQVPGFENQEACLRAASAWLEEARKPSSGGGLFNSSALCVKDR